MRLFERNSAAFIFMFYALAVFSMAIFVLMWDNKGTKSFWDKNFNDWLTLIWLLSVTLISFLSAMHCYIKKHLNYILLICLVTALVVNMSYVFSWDQEQPLLYYGLVHGLVLIGCGLWWHSSHATKP